MELSKFARNEADLETVQTKSGSGIGPSLSAPMGKRWEGMNRSERINARWNDG